MKPFANLKVFGRLVPAYRVKGLVEQEGAMGLFHIPDVREPKPVILVDDQLKNDDYWQTLIHELFHAVLHRTHLNTGMSEEIEEAVVDQFATAMTENFKIQLKKSA